jgi:hypothetical protein
LTTHMDQGERALLAGLPEVGYAAGSPGGWNGLWQKAVGHAMGRDESSPVHVEEGRGLAATIWAELTR